MAPCFAEIRIAQLNNDVEKLYSLAWENVEISLARGEKRSAAISGFDLAEYYFRVEHFEEAESLIDQLLEDSRQTNLLRAPIRSWLFKSQMTAERGQIELAEEYLQHASGMA